MPSGNATAFVKPSLNRETIRPAQLPIELREPGSFQFAPISLEPALASSEPGRDLLVRPKPARWCEMEIGHRKTWGLS